MILQVILDECSFPLPMWVLSKLRVFYQTCFDCSVQSYHWAAYARWHKRPFFRMWVMQLCMQTRPTIVFHVFVACITFTLHVWIPCVPIPH